MPLNMKQSTEIKKIPIGILSSDWHLEETNLPEKRNLIQQKIKLAKQLGIKNCFVLGDIFTERKAQPLINLGYGGFKTIIEDFLEEGLKLYAIAGNHDKVNYKSENSYLDIFDKDLSIYRKVDSLSLDAYNMEIWFLPYFDEKETALSYINQLNPKKDKINILLTHLSIDGVPNNDKNVVRNDILPGLFTKFTQVFVGHYHNRGDVGKNIHYIGSLNPGNFAEDGYKGFTILYSDGSFEYKSANFKLYKKVVIDLTKQQISEVDKLVEDYKDSEDIIRFEFIGTEAQLKAIDDNKIKKSGIDIKKKQLEIEEQIIKASNNEFVSFDKVKIIEEFNIFCEERKLQNIKYGEEKLTQILK